MRSALIGYTGFVGGNIKQQHSFTDYYNSRNIADIEGKSYDLVVSAANRAEMWKINKEPEKDRSEIDEYISHIKKAKIRKLVLISTVGVYKHTNNVNEDSKIETDGLLPYGVNRYYLENYCREAFDTIIVRLPGLYGDGIKKNVIFDLLHNNQLDKIHRDGVYQYYNLDNIWRDIEIALKHGLSLLNLATPPVSTEEVAKEAFGMEFTNLPENVTPAIFDVRTKYAKIFGAEDDYICSKEQELSEIRNFVRRYKGKA